MKMLFAGSLMEGQTSRMRMDIFRALDFDVASVCTETGWQKLSSPSRRAQQFLHFGPAIDQINRSIIEAAKLHKPRIFWAEKQEYIFPSTLRKLSEINVRSIHYTPDPYFSLGWKQTPNSDACLPLYDALVTSKQYEIQRYQEINPRSYYMHLGFSTDVHRPINNDQERFSSDVAFLGGWEPRREKYLNFLLKHTGANLKIWGYGWDFLKDGKWTPRRWWSMRRNSGNQVFKLAKNDELGQCVMGGEVYGNEYSSAISGAKINIGFLRKICPDQHTTRTFEIPACKSLLLADRSEEHMEFFREGVEAEFFSSMEEMLDKVRFYLDNDRARRKIAQNGYDRCHRDGYSYFDLLSKTSSNIIKDLDLLRS